MTQTYRSCSVVDGADCECPPGGLVGDPRPVRCYTCGGDVCRSCSALITYRRRRCRVCFTCQDDRRIGRSTPPRSESQPATGRRGHA